jgi:hypothetical protein
MKILIFIFLIIICENAYSNEQNVYEGQFGESIKTYTFDNIKIYKEPVNNDSNIIDTLPIGYEVEIITLMKEKSISRGYEQSWCVIQYNKNSKLLRGYVWGGLLSIGYLSKDTNFLLIGLNEYIKGKGFIGECKLVQNNKLVSNLKIYPPSSEIENQTSDYTYSFRCSILQNTGLNAFDSIIRLFFYPPNDGDEAGNIIVGIKNNNLIFIAKERNRGEGGVGSESESYIFPNEEGGVKDKIKYIYLEYTFDEDKSEDVLTKKIEKYFIWENNKLIEKIDEKKQK